MVRSWPAYWSTRVTCCAQTWLEFRSSHPTSSRPWSWCSAPPVLSLSECQWYQRCACTHKWSMGAQLLKTLLWAPLSCILFWNWTWPKSLHLWCLCVQHWKVKCIFLLFSVCLFSTNKFVLASFRLWKWKVNLKNICWMVRMTLKL